MSFSVGIDARMAQHTGIGTYLRGILGSLRPPAGLQIALFGPAAANPSSLHFQTQPFCAPIYSAAEQLEYPLRLARCRLWHAPHYNVPLIKGKCRLVVTIHDIIHWIYRRQFLTPLQAFYAQTLLRAAVRSADRIITVSENTRRDLVEHFKADSSKIEVIYEGVNEDFRPVRDRAAADAVLKKYGIPGPYFFYVGLMKPHKNVLWLIKLYRELRRQKKIRATLVLVGRKDRRYPPGHEELQKLSSDGEIIYIPQLERGELQPLYGSALALVHPSLYEGFGLTLLEAMACGTPVAALRTSSIPEVAGDAALLVDPHDDEGMKNALVELEGHTVLREKLGARGRARAAHFRWKDAAEKTLQVYQDVLENA